MPTSRREIRTSRAFALPLFGIVVLLTCYWLLAEWQELPAMVHSVISATHWPL